MKRVFDISMAALWLLILSPVFLVIGLIIKATSPGPVFYVSDRIGVNNTLFHMFKFRTMRPDTPQLATHLMSSPGQYLTPIGRVLRKTSLDELPQLINVLKGDMSFVGPRPALFNQDDLAALRTAKGVHILIPGITGWAQTHGRDEISIPEKVELDCHYLTHRSFRFDLKILWLTLVNVIKRKDIAH